MAIRRQPSQEADQQQREYDAIRNRIAIKVMRKLGNPDNLHRVGVTRVYDNHYRVNVYVRTAPIENGVKGMDEVHIKHSFFVHELDSTQDTLVADPPIKRAYDAPPTELRTMVAKA